MPHPENIKVLEVEQRPDIEPHKAAAIGNKLLNSEVELGIEEHEVSTSPERNLERPHYKVHMLLGAHNGYEDFTEVRDRLREGSDIYIYEEPSGMPADHPELSAMLSMDQSISDADPNDPAIRDALQEELDAMKPIVHKAEREGFASTRTIVDTLPYESYEQDELLARESDFGVERFAQFSNFEEALGELEDQTGRYAHQQREREIRNARKLGPKLDEIIEAHPELKDKDEINVVMSMGSIHTTYFDEIAQSDPNIDIDRAFMNKDGRSTYVYDSLGRLVRQKMRDEANGAHSDLLSTNKELLSKTYTRLELDTQLGHTLRNESDEPVPNHDELVYYYNMVTDAFDYDDAEGLFIARKQGDLDSAKFNEILASKGLPPLPQTPAELKELTELAIKNFQAKYKLRTHKNSKDQ